MRFETNRSSGPSNPNIIRLQDGQSVVGVLRGDPVTFERAFKPGEKSKFRFWVNFIVKEEGSYKAKILDGGWKLFAQLKELQDAGWVLETSWVKVSRTGKGQNDTTYSATPSPQPVIAETLAAISKVSLLPLNLGTTTPGSSGGGAAVSSPNKKTTPEPGSDW